MLEQFLDYIRVENLFDPTRHRLLLAISGGKDSVVLARLLAQSATNFALAHCNFCLRGEESEGDEQWLRAFAQKQGLRLYVQRFDTEKIATQNGLSIQVAARQLRYNWLEQLRAEEGFDYIVTAHHINDAIETLIFNLAKGCGIRGLHGILPKDEERKLLRPLLFGSKEAIENYIKINELDYREDSSNAGTKYTRNQIRHQIVPLLRRLNPNLEGRFAESFRQLREAEQLYHYASDRLAKELLQPSPLSHAIWQLPIAPLLAAPAPMSLLYEWLLPYGFNSRQAQQIIAHAKHQTGGYYASTEGYRLWRNYDHLILEKISFDKKESTPIVILEEEGQLPKVQDLPNGKTLILDWADETELRVLNLEKGLAFFDANIISLPLGLRYPKQGDSFCPLGMKGQHKKLSAFFKDIKIPLAQRSSIPLLINSIGQIVWVVGWRADERFKVTKNSTKIIKAILR